MKKKDLVSVIIPCYNQGKFLIECVDSVEKQTYSDIEIIIVNDGSTDQETLDILEFIKENKPYVTVLTTINCGVSASRNKGISVSNGVYIVPLDGDDKLHPNFISKCIDIFDNHDVDIVYSNTRLFGTKNHIYGLPKFNSKKLLKQNIVVCTAMYRKCDFNHTQGYNESMVHGLEDWEFWLQMLELEKKFFRIEEILFYYRIKKKSRNTTIMREKSSEILMYEEIYSNHKELYSKFNIDFSNIIPKRGIVYKIVNKIRMYFYIIEIKFWRGAKEE